MAASPRFAAAFCLLLATPPLAAETPAPPAPEAPPTPLQVPAVDEGANTLKVRQIAQQRTADQFGVFNGFHFVDRQAESGIDFVHHPLPEGRESYTMVHYDHGNGVAGADVDGDGRLDLYFVDQAGPNRLYRNLGGGRFEDVTAAAGVAVGDRVSVTASFADLDNDGDPDLYVTSVRGGNLLFENDGKGHFKDVTATSGLGVVAHSSGSVFFDYDRDGKLDLFLTNVGVYTSNERHPSGSYVGLGDAFRGHLMPERAETNRLFRNAGGLRFEDVSAAAGIQDTTWSGDASFADLDGDGFLDLYVLNMQGDDRFYRNDGGKRFVDKSAETFPRSPWGAMGIKFFDGSGDGRLDLVLTDMHSDMSAQQSPEAEKLKSVMTWSDETLQGGANNIFGNAYWEQQPDGSFVERSDDVGLENYWPWGVSVGDFNADGWEDVFIASSMCYPYRYALNSLLLNDHGSFRDAELILGVEPRKDGRTHQPWFILDCSGPDAHHEHCEGKTGRFEVIGALGTRSSIIFDVDGDGDLDLVTHEFNAPAQVLVSDLSERRPVRWLGVDLTGKKSNRDGLGAKVVVHAGGRALTQQVDGKSGYLSQSSMPLWFGLGEATKVDRVEVLWPSGERQTVTEGLALGATVEIVEGQAAARPTGH